MKVYFNAKDIELKTDENQETQLTKKQVEKIKLYAKARTIQLIKNKRK